MSTTDTDWITPGAEVVVWRDSYGGGNDPKRSTIVKVAKQSFTVEGCDERIKLDTMTSKRLGGTWNSWQYRVVHPESEQARKLFDAQRRSRLENRAWSATETWRRDRTQENRLAAIEALQAVED